jgi:hypothetical protein
MLNRERVRQRTAGPLVAAETTKEIGEKAIPARPTDNPLISLETAKEKVWKSLEKFGKAWNFLGKIWKSLKKLGAPAIGCSASR